MYKVFFNDRTVFFGDDFSRAFLKHKGLFYKYNNFMELNELVGLFDSLNKINNLYILHENILGVFEEFKACFKVIEAGGGVVLNDRGEFLVILRNGIWDLPKGKLEKGEDFATAAMREVEEETGLQGLKMLDPLSSTYHTYKLKGKRILKKTKWFVMQYSGSAEPVLQAEEGISDYRWAKAGSTGFIRENTFASILDVLYMRNLL
ncbi:MAG: NUDIX hydrolase [Bacteroidetes bacterium]|nr:MAG: NUDIX hydrolase [Bacteroidota bacterium]RLD72582.1 MAG: NUDIX hydrolase [Bacteroidota bacterium]RLD92849.1 MAG: NUDIX hydrolase [Bacteroidota bacterium]